MSGGRGGAARPPGETPRGWWITLALAGCGRLVVEDTALWPPPETGATFEREVPEGFDPCPHLDVEAPFPLSSSATGTSDPRIAWNQDTGQYMVVWREEELDEKGVVVGKRIGFQRLDDDGQPVGLQDILREGNRSPIQADGDPAILWVPNQQHSPFFVAVQRGTTMGVDRVGIQGDGRVTEMQNPLGEALELDGVDPPVAREQRIPPMATDGTHVAIAFLTREQNTLMVSLDFDPNTGAARCNEALGDDPAFCATATGGPIGPASIGWLPPSAATEAPINDESPAPWMAVRTTTRMFQWIGLGPAHDEFYPHPEITTAGDLVAGPRIATANRRFAVALRREDGGTEAWQVAIDGIDSCILAAPSLSAGTPAVVWGHGRRVAVAGLVPRAGGTDVYLVRGDAPATQAARERAIGEPCPAPLDEEKRLTRTPHVVARDPDMAFSGAGFGIVWAETSGEDPDGDAEVWFAHARCVP